MVTSYVETAF